MSTSTTTAATVVAAVDRFERLFGRRLQQITSLTWRGWTVHIVDGEAVTVPMQPLDGKSSADLAAILRSAYSAVTVGDPGSGPTTGLRRVRPGTELADAVAEVISVAADRADRHRRQSFDVYDCLKQAWAGGGMAVPFGAVLAAVRQALGDGTLADFTEHADSEAIYALLRRAQELATGQPNCQAITA